MITAQKITEMAKALFQNERKIKRLDGWFLIKESNKNHSAETTGMSEVRRAAYLLNKAVEELPLSIDRNAVFAGTQRDAFARSYALINPSFRVETFSGYCDPTAVYGDIEPNDEFTAERIAEVKKYDLKSKYVRLLSDTYKKAENETSEVVYFIEQVTGHVIPDVRFLLKNGVKGVLAKIEQAEQTSLDHVQREEYAAMRISMETLLCLAKRYADIAEQQIENCTDDSDNERLKLMIQRLHRVPADGARTLPEAIQSFILIWQLMCLEQAPNPFAFSVGNADRIFEPYRGADSLSREETAAYLKHFLVFFNVADRSWAISQNIILSGKDINGADLTNPTTYAFLDAYYDMNLPQPILSVKLHKNSPSELYADLGRFFFTPGCLTPSLFNDDSLFPVLENAGVEKEDLPDYSIAGCQEPLIMGKDNGNTTNSWLNLGKILELSLTGGVSLITGNTIDPCSEEKEPIERLKHIREIFYGNVRRYAEHMAEAANNATEALSHMPVPFLSSMMGGLDSGYDMRDIGIQGTKYNGSGCLIHGLAVVADSFVAVDHFLKERSEDAGILLQALRCNFEGYEELRSYLQSCPKYGCNNSEPDKEAADIAVRTAEIVRSQKNNLGNPFRPDFSTPSTHLLYGYWVGALPDGRKSREMLNYGIDPLAGDAHEGMGFRILSAWKLPFMKMCGGYASHLGIDPRYFREKEYPDRGLEFERKIIKPLFFNEKNTSTAPFYLYVNVTTPDILRKVLANPAKYAPNGVYIMRIHGTFVNFLDLSPAIQQDIIRRLDPASASL